MNTFELHYVTSQVSTRVPSLKVLFSCLKISTLSRMGEHELVELTLKSVHLRTGICKVKKIPKLQNKLGWSSNPTNLFVLKTHH